MARFTPASLRSMARSSMQTGKWQSYRSFSLKRVTRNLSISTWRDCQRAWMQKIFGALRQDYSLAEISSYGNGYSPVTGQVLRSIGREHSDAGNFQSGFGKPFRKWLRFWCGIVVGGGRRVKRLCLQPADPIRSAANHQLPERFAGLTETPRRGRRFAARLHFDGVYNPVSA